MNSTIVLPNNHITYTSSRNVESICQELFNSTPITYFSYASTYKDGSYYIFSTNPKWIMYLFENELVLDVPFTSETINKRLYFNLWENCIAQARKLIDVHTTQRGNLFNLSLVILHLYQSKSRHSCKQSPSFLRKQESQHDGTR